MLDVLFNNWLRNFIKVFIQNPLVNRNRDLTLDGFLKFSNTCKQVIKQGRKLFIWRSICELNLPDFSQILLDNFIFRINVLIIYEILLCFNKSFMIIWRNHISMWHLNLKPILFFSTISHHHHIEHRISKHLKVVSTAWSPPLVHHNWGKY